MSDERAAPGRSPSLTDAQAVITALRAQLQSGALDPTYLEDGLAEVAALLHALIEQNHTRARVTNDDAASAFVRVAAHELKTPMTSILGYADMLMKRSGGALTPQQQELLTIIVRNVRRMAALLSDLTDLNRIETGRVGIELEAVDIADIIEQTRLATARQIEERRHSLVVNVPPNIPRVMADPKRLLQVMVNLVSNAYRYTPNGGIITLACQRRDDRVWIAVRDTGIGMTPEEQARLGSPFWRADHPQVTGESGAGLGYAIARSLVELMGGEIALHSRPGEGSLFAITLPVA